MNNQKNERAKGGRTWPTVEFFFLAAWLATAQIAPAGFAPLIEPGRPAQWRAGPDAPEATITAAGPSFPCPFTAQNTRFYWDYPAAADLTPGATIELELTCPETVQSVGLYLKSGRGWYLWIKPVLKAGRQKLILQIREAATEGRPAGWHKITGVRISLQNNLPANGAVTLHRLAAGNSDLMLIQGTSSAPNNEERKVAEKTTARLSKWLEDLGLAHSVLDDEALAAGRARPAKIIILPYNPCLSEKQLKRLETFLAAGGKIIVFYGRDPRLAELLGLRLGKYQVAAAPGQWSGFQFNRSAPEGVPPKIIQESGNIFTVYPASAQSRIIASWQDAAGRLLSDPAWVQSEKGAWMTHILSGEDSAKKKTMLLALLGQYDRGIRPAAAPDKAGAGRATEQRPRAGEFRGVWNHSGLGLYPGDWHKTCRLLARAGITAVLPNALWPGAALYPSQYVPQSRPAKQFGDQLAQCVAAARQAGLEIHVWKVCWNLAWADKDFLESMRRQGRRQKNNRGEELNWLCPSDPANIALELNTLLEVVRGYDLDGLHLDYIRYPDQTACYCPGCRQRYENWSGQKIKSWPQDAFAGKHSGPYRQWRSRQITDFVRRARQAIKKIKPRVKLSAAVYPKYPDCLESVGQDWGRWLQEDLLDFACPMDYFPSVAAFQPALQSQLSLGAGRIYPGLGVTLNEGDLDQEVFLGQLRALRAGAAGGFLLFDLNPSLAANFLPLLAGP